MPTLEVEVMLQPSLRDAEMCEEVNQRRPEWRQNRSRVQGRDGTRTEASRTQGAGREEREEGVDLGVCRA